MPKKLVAQTSTTVNAPPPKVWQALVDPALVNQYFFGATVISDWKKGSTIVWRGDWKGKPYEDKGVILDIVPQKRLQYTHFSPLTGQPDTPENHHTITIDLSPAGKGTRLVLSQDNNATEEERDKSAKNWESMLASIKKLVEGR
jgi:uncharacterized protein YndB with AHSA1/START domain